MRAGCSPALERRLRRADPAAHPIVEAIAVDAEDSKRTKDDWDGATGSGFTILDTGGIRLSGSIGALVEHTTDDGNLTDLSDDGTEFAALMIQLAGSEPLFTRLARLKLYLDPNTGGGQQVATWRVRLFGVNRVEGRAEYDAGENLKIGFFTGLSLFPIGEPVDVAAGASAGLVTFDYSLQRPILKWFPATWPIGTKVGVGGIDADYVSPVVFAVVYALQADGQPAGNVGLARDSASDEVTASGNRISSRLLTRQADGWYKDGDTGGGCPRCAVEISSFADTIAYFQDAGNRLDLGAVPTGTVEFIAKAEVPPGTAVTFYVRNDADSAWVAFQDGDTTDDLSGVGKNQTYKVYVDVDADSGGDLTPVVRVVGVRELTRVSFDGLATIEGPRWSIDPVSQRGEIGEATITLIRDGERDGRDAISDLLTTYDVGDIVFEVWMGHEDLDRNHWLLVETLLIDDYRPFDDHIEIVGVTPLAQLKQALPRPTFLSVSGVNLTFADASGSTPATITRAAGSWSSDGFLAGDLVIVTGSSSNDGTYPIAAITGSGTVLELAQGQSLTAEGPTSSPTVSANVRRAYEQANQGLKTVADDLLDTQLALPARYRGPGIEDDTTQASRTLALQDDLDAKRALDEIAYLAGGAWISSQGQVKFVPLFDPGGVTGVAHVFPAEEIRLVSAAPGFAQRKPEAFVLYDWYAPERRFRGEVYAVNTAGLAQLGNAYIEPKRVDESICRWISAAALAQTAAQREVEYRGTGVLLWTWESVYAYPELEPGDLVAIETAPFVAKDPFTGAALRGRLWALAMVVGVSGVEGRRFTGWVRSWADLFGTLSTIDLDPEAVPEIEAYFLPLKGNPGQVQVRLGVPAGATAYYVVQDWGTTVPTIGAGSWTVYGGPFTVSQLEDLDRQLCVYADRNGVYSSIRRWRIDKDAEPEVTLTLSEPVALTVRASWTPDDDVTHVRLYLGTNLAGNGWPTLNNNSDGILDEAKLVGTIAVEQDGGSWDRTGSPLAGILDGTGTARTGIGGTRYEQGSFSGSDVVKVIAVPLDRAGNAGDRATASITVANSAAAALTAFAASNTAAGSSCGSGAQNTVSWTPNGSVSDGSHDLKIYRSRDGEPPVLVKTEANPATTTSYVDTVEDYEDTGSGIWYEYVYTYELVAAGPTVIDSGAADAIEIEVTGLCPTV